MVKISLKRFYKVYGEDGRASYECPYCRHTTDTSGGMWSHVNRHHNTAGAFKLDNEPGEPIDSGSITEHGTEAPEIEAPGIESPDAVEPEDWKFRDKEKNVCPACGSNGMRGRYEVGGMVYEFMCPECFEVWGFSDKEKERCSKCGAELKEGRIETAGGWIHGYRCDECGTQFGYGGEENQRCPECGGVGYEGRYGGTSGRIYGFCCLECREVWGDVEKVSPHLRG